MFANLQSPRRKNRSPPSKTFAHKQCTCKSTLFNWVSQTNSSKILLHLKHPVIKCVTRTIIRLRFFRSYFDGSSGCGLVALRLLHLLLLVLYFLCLQLTFKLLLLLLQPFFMLLLTCSLLCHKFSLTVLKIFYLKF